MPIPIYHITNIDNLARIVQTGGLWCDAERVRQGFACIGIAHENLKARRERTPAGPSRPGHRRWERPSRLRALLLREPFPDALFHT